jgi:predicted negative regulator of RcsB-dependent stress response
VRQLRLRGNWSRDVIIFVVLLIIALAILIPWRLSHLHTHQRQSPLATER